MAQITSGTSPRENLRRIADATTDAADQGARLVVFPEAAMCRVTVPLAPIAEPLDGRFATGLLELAAKRKTTVVAGMFTLGDERDGRQRVRNTVVVAHPDGSLVPYHKIHLYDAFGFSESATVQPGSELVTTEVDGAVLGVATCYDVRFPGVFTALAERDAQIIVLPASWGAGPGKVDQWRTLVAARGLDAGAHIVAVDQAQPEPAPISTAPTGVGHSMLVTPYGRVVYEAPSGPDLFVTDVDPALAGKARAATGVIANRRI